ncbi:MAG: hypothetical protein QM500_08925, partial [Methylococcales bacterium]
SPVSYVGINIDNGQNPNGLFEVQTTGGVSRFVVQSDGDVGIGTKVPSAKLEVVGNAKIDGDLDVTGTLSFIRKATYATGNGPDDDTDSGQIVSRVLTVNKLKDNTVLRIGYTDSMRTYLASKSCRWEIKIDGASCPGQSLIYDYYNISTDIMLYRSQNVVGYCSGISSGSKQVQVWVSSTPGYSDSDCYTGWKESTWVLEAEEVLN